MIRRNPIDYLSKKFIVYVTLVVVLIIVVANYVRFDSYKEQVLIDMDGHAMMTLGYISNFSLHYIDTYETELLKNLHAFSLRDKNIQYLVIDNYLSNEVFGRKLDSISVNVKDYTKELIYDGRIIGRIQMGFNRSEYDSRINNFMIVSSQIVVVVSFLLIGLIFVFYKRNIASEISRFRLALDGSSDAIYLIDKESLRFIDSNKKGWEVLGYSRDDLLGFRIVDLCTVCNSCEPSADICFKKDCNMMSGRRLHFKGSKGAVVPMEVYFDDVTYGSDRLLVAIARDITQALKAESDLLEAKENAEKANRAKSEFLSCMSHELRTPLNAVLGFGQLLEMSLTDKDERENVRYILDAGNHLLSLVNDVLDLSRIDSGNLKLKIETLDPFLLIQDCLNMAVPMAKKYSVTVVVDESCNNLPAIQADRSRFSQVLLNILSNAIKYNNMDGTVVISCSLLSAGRLRIKVKDTGIGIPASRYCELFTPFQRLGAEGGAIEGVGIGLSMTKQLVKMMSGVIGFDSEEGKGSLFWFDLPVAGVVVGEQVKAVADQDPIVELNKTGTLKILYIEDNPSNQSLMQGILDRVSGVELSCIHNAEMGLEIIAHSDVDLVFMDIDLPGMSGIEATQILKQDEATRDIPVIAVTANAMQSDIDSASATGFELYLTKPFDVVEIIGIISNMCNR